MTKSVFYKLMSQASNQLLFKQYIDSNTWKIIKSTLYSSFIRSHIKNIL